MTLTNGGAIPHSIDFHAARIAPNMAFRDVAPGESFTFRFKAGDPGVFMYHCGTKPVLAHIANGMYGAIVVSPAKALPPVDNEYVLVASEWYLNSDGITKPASLDMAKARSMNPDWTTFNGYANQYVTHPLTAKPGETTRFYVVAAGPTLDTQLPRRRLDLDRAWVNGDMTSPPQVGVQTVHRSRRRRRRLRRQDRRRGAVPVRQPRLRPRRPRPGRPAEGRQSQGDDDALMVDEKMQGMTSELDAPAREDLELLDGYWRAANYLSVGQIYLLGNPLLRELLQPEHVKPRLLGHFGTVPGLNLVYAHLNRAIRARDLNAIFVTGPGHGGPANVANAYLEGTYSELYPNVGEGEEGLRELFRQFSYPGGIPSHAAPETPGSIHEGGELGYALVHAFGAAFDNPDLRRGLRRRRRRGRDRPARRELALEQVPQSAQRRRRPADPAPERLEDRQPDRPRADPRAASCWRSSRAMAGSRSSSRAASTVKDRRGCTSASPPRSTARSTRSHRSRRQRGRAVSPSGRGGRCSSSGRRRAGRGRARSTACRSRERGARTRCRSPASARARTSSGGSRSGCAATGPRSSSTRRAACCPSWPLRRRRAIAG